MIADRRRDDGGGAFDEKVVVVDEGDPRAAGRRNPAVGGCRNAPVDRVEDDADTRVPLDVLQEGEGFRPR